MMLLRIGIFPVIDRPILLKQQPYLMIFFANILIVSHEGGLLLTYVSDHLPVYLCLQSWFHSSTRTKDESYSN